MLTYNSSLDFSTVDRQIRHDIHSVAHKEAAATSISETPGMFARAICGPWLAQRPTDSVTSPSQLPSTLSAAHCRCSSRDVAVF